jgi:hypothetical protein
MEDQKTCSDPELHHQHMCGRKDKTALPEVQCLSYAPTVKCGICGALAASVSDVCTPVKIFEEDQLP